MPRRRRADTDEGHPRSRRAAVFTVMAALVGATACFPPDEGQNPNPDQIYFPVGLALSPARATPPPDGGVPELPTHRWLYVANSDFDLQFNAGTVQAYDLKRIDEVITFLNPRAADPAERCPDSKDKKLRKTVDEQFVAPGICAAVNTEIPPDGKGPLLRASVKIGAFATDVRYIERPADKQPGSDMLVVPVRGDDTLHWIETDANSDEPGKLLDCGSDAQGMCNDEHRRGKNPAAENTRDADLPREPFGIAADDRGEAIVTTHQSDGALGLFVNDWSGSGPNLQFVLTGLPIGAVGLTSVPEPDITRALRLTSADVLYEPGFYVTFRNAAQVQLIRYFSDQGEFKNPNLPTLPNTYPTRAFLEPGAVRGIDVNSQGYDSRGIAVDGSARRACELGCDADPGPASCRKTCVDAPDDDKKGDPTFCDPNTKPPTACTSYVQCLKGCAATQLKVFVSNRTPPTLILGQTSPNSSATSSDDLPVFYDTEPLSIGPSRVVTGSVKTPNGPSGRVFVICYDTRQIFVYNPKARRIEAVIRTGRGPHAFAVDEGRGLGYVGHFTDSYIGVVDLDQSNVTTYGKIILSIGERTAPRAQK